MTDEQKEFEELVSVVDKVLRYGAKCPNSKYCEFCGGTLSMPCSVCKIVTELQNANYRKGEVISYQAAFDAQTANRIAQLENELVIAQGTKNRLTIFDRIKISDNAKISTAKDILSEFGNFIGSRQKFCIVDEQRKELIEVGELFGLISRLAKKYMLEAAE